MGIWQTIKSTFSRNEGFVPMPKQPRTVAERFALLVLVAELADSVALEDAGAIEPGRAMRKRALDQLLALGFGPHSLEPRERQFVMSLRSGQVSLNDATAAMWRLECAGVLAWALGHEPAILPVERAVELAPLRALVPPDEAALRTFSESATVRPIGTLLQARSEWSMRWFPMEGAPPTEERSRVLERMRAIRWLTEPALVELSSTRVVGAS